MIEVKSECLKHKSTCRMTRALPLYFVNTYVDLNPKLIGAEGTRLLRDQRACGDPAGELQRGDSTTAPRKASAFSGNQPAGSSGHFPCLCLSSPRRRTATRRLPAVSRKVSDCNRE
ncbi:hypothetical protein [Heyndrickxia acidicola]|uniref:Uncharacterized protein n=1 Tax=Heyndrickxia acidicola TaxID=209389 RepID=A0ABU6MLN9_9BACI|nr:hypothetical protein [Heyndrickxia acidicola]